MLQMKKGVESYSLPVVKTPANKTAANPPGSKGGEPIAPVHPTPDPGRAAASARKASQASPASTSSRAGGSRTQGKPRAEGPASGSAKSAERREAHTGHATVVPAGREPGGGGSGEFHRNGHPDIQDWMPFSAQQSRIARMPRANLAKAIPHPLLPLKSAVFSMARHLYTEVLPSLFRRTPQETERNNRMIRKDVLRMDKEQRTVRNEARRETIRKRAEANPKRVMAGDLSQAFATS